MNVRTCWRHRARRELRIAATLFCCGAGVAWAEQSAGQDASPQAPVLNSVQAPAGRRDPGPAGQGATNAPAPSDKKLKRLHLLITGHVQGVGFRDFTRRKVETLNLRITGWVKNLPDGRVEIVAEGPAKDLEQLVAEVTKGPREARVDNVERTEEVYTGSFKRFTIEYADGAR